jgi:hypothetical protein
LQAAAAAGALPDGPASDYEVNSLYEQHDDYAGDSALTESVTINSRTLTVTNNAVYDIGGYGEGLSGIVTGCIVASCVGGPSATGGLFRSAIDGYQSGVEFELSTDQNYAIGDILSQTEMDALLGSAPITGKIYIDPGCSICTDHLFIGVESTTTYGPPQTPEPATPYSDGARTRLSWPVEAPLRQSLLSVPNRIPI